MRGFRRAGTAAPPNTGLAQLLAIRTFELCLTLCLNHKLRKFTGGGRVSDSDSAQSKRQLTGSSLVSTGHETTCRIVLDAKDRHTLRKAIEVAVDGGAGDPELGGDLRNGELALAVVVDLVVHRLAGSATRVESS